MTLDKIVYDIREALKQYSDDSELDDRYIIYLVNIKRQKYLKQKLDNIARRFNSAILQTLCLKTEIVSVNECGLSLNCDTIVRTAEPIPNLLQMSTKDALQRVSPSDRLSQKFNLIDRERAPLYLNSNYKNKIKTFLHDDGHLYFVSAQPLMLECVSITGVFEDPTELGTYNNCCDCDNAQPCYNYLTSDYPLQGDLIDLVRSDIINERASLSKNIKEDKTNNANDN